jgi:hypothetical protein
MKRKRVSYWIKGVKSGRKYLSNIWRLGKASAVGLADCMARALTGEPHLSARTIAKPLNNRSTMVLLFDHLASPSIRGHGAPGREIRITEQMFTIATLLVHSPRTVMVRLERSGGITMSYAPHIPDLDPCDFSAFCGHNKEQFKRKSFADGEELFAMLSEATSDPPLGIISGVFSDSDQRL